jgi:heme-degrading monooxygenase HmoA
VFGGMVSAMFARLTWAEGPPDKLDDLITLVRSAPESIGQLEGYQGTILLANRSSGAAVAATYWESADAMHASEAAAEGARATVTSNLAGFQVKDIDRLEFVLQVRVAPPSANTFVRVNDSQVVPAKLAVLTDFMRQQVIPAVKVKPGFRAALMLANRQSGRVLAISVWETAADREASSTAVAELRGQAQQVGGAEQTTVDTYEAVLAEVKQTAHV